MRERRGRDDQLFAVVRAVRTTEHDDVLCGSDFGLRGARLGSTGPRT